MCKGRQKRTNTTKFHGFFPFDARINARNRPLPRTDGAVLSNLHTLLAHKRGARGFGRGGHRLLLTVCNFFLTVPGFSDFLLRVFVLTAHLLYVFLQLSTIITERDHEKVIDFRRISCRACAAQEGFHGIRLQSEKSFYSFFSPPLLQKATFLRLGKGNGGALPYDPLFTLLLCDVLRTI